MSAGKYTYEDYTFEDYTRDFELDYLGFDGIPDEPVSDLSSEKNTGNELKQQADGFDKN